MSVELDHVFVLTARDAQLPSGLRESYRRDHLGQGSGNVCACFDNAFLEMLWLRPEDPPIGQAQALRLKDRSTEAGASPYGIAVRTTKGEALPFATWSYRPAYLPPGVSIEVARSSQDIAQPLLFAFPEGRRPDDGDRPCQDRLAEIVALRISVPEPGPELRTLAAMGVIELSAARAHALTLLVSQRGSGAATEISFPAAP